MNVDRLEGAARLTPALGQQKLYVLVFAADRDLQQVTILLDPVETYTEGVGSAAPDIPDPITRCTTGGPLKLRAETSSPSSMLARLLFDPSDPGPVTVGNTVASTMAYTAPVTVVAAPAPQPVKKNEPMLNDTESYFNQAARDAMVKGDVNKALKLFDEAECLKSKSARSILISSVKGKG